MRDFYIITLTTVVKKLISFPSLSHFLCKCINFHRKWRGIQLRIFLDKRREVNLSPADFHLIAIATVKLGKAILISDIVSNNVRMLPKVRAAETVKWLR